MCMHVLAEDKWRKTRGKTNDKNVWYSIGMCVYTPESKLFSYIQTLYISPLYSHSGCSGIFSAGVSWQTFTIMDISFHLLYPGNYTTLKKPILQHSMQAPITMGKITNSIVNIIACTCTIYHSYHLIQQVHNWGSSPKETTSLGMYHYQLSLSPICLLWLNILAKRQGISVTKLNLNF